MASRRPSISKEAAPLLLSKQCRHLHDVYLVSGSSFTCTSCDCRFDRDAQRVECECGHWCMQCMLLNEHQRSRPAASSAPLRTSSELPFPRNLISANECLHCGGDLVVAIFPATCNLCEGYVRPLCGFQCVDCLGGRPFGLCSICALTRGPEDNDGNSEANRHHPPSSGITRPHPAILEGLEVDARNRLRDAQLEDQFLHQLQSLGDQLRRLSGALNTRELAQPDCNPDEDFVSVEVPDLKCIEGHALRSGHYGRLGWSCDSCGEGYGPRSIAIQCRPCQYDICLECAAKDFAVKCSHDHKMVPNSTEGAQHCCQCCQEFGLWQGFVCDECQSLASSTHDEKVVSEDDVRGRYLCVACALTNHNNGTVPAMVHPNAPSMPAPTGFSKCSVAEVCSVCLSLCNDPDRQAVQLSCPGKHIFHSECIAVWLKDHHTCPVCRVDTAGRKH